MQNLLASEEEREGTSFLFSDAIQFSFQNHVADNGRIAHYLYHKRMGWTRIPCGCCAGIWKNI